MSAVLDRLDRAGLDDDVELQVLAACEGQLDSLLGDGDYTRPTQQPAATVEPPGVYLGDLTVEGFRGIGDRRTLPLRPGPGLTLVVGRNGSGKSSFAEAAEMLLTGANRRWADRPADWQKGWRNLHCQDACEISAEVAIDGEAGPVTLHRRWTGDDLDESDAVVRAPGRPDRPIDALGWEQALAWYRPFLSYNELGSMLTGKPSELHDAMSSILGLDALEDAVKALAEARRVRARQMKDARTDLQPLLEELSAADDERAARCHAALSGRAWDLDAVDEILLADELDAEAGGALATLRGIASVTWPTAEEIDKVAGALTDAQRAVDAFAGTNVGRADAVAEILTAALHAHETHGDQDCPVCGSGRLDAAWRAAATAEAERLRREASDARQARSRLDEATQAARTLVGEPPPYLMQADRAGLDARDAVAAWRRLGDLPEDPAETAAHLRREHPPFVTAITLARNAAVAELDRRNAEWLPLARRLAQWAATAREALTADALAKRLKIAEQWLKDAASDLRNARFRPIADEARALWAQLRQQSSVQLDDLTLAGTGTRRHLEMEVSVDGSDGSALGVMSQGELHALALSLFLPRATLPESPFRFLVIDDPVQSMDPARVEGLARVLERVARTRQVIVFTHDDRLPESVRRLGIDARILGVTRRPRSQVEVHEELEPVARNIEDARALVLSREVPDQIVARVVPGLCRSAVEAACVEVVRRRRLRRGEPHADVDAAISAARTTMNLVALALFDDASRGSAVLGRINRWSPELADALQWCRRGAHGESSTSRAVIRTNIDRTEQLAARLREIQ